MSAHPKIFLELALMKLLQQGSSNEIDVSSIGEIQELKKQIHTLQQQVEQLNSRKPVTIQENTNQVTAKPKRTRRSQATQSKASTAKVMEILKNANKQSLQLVTSRWGDVMEKMRTTTVPGHAWLSDSKPVAASSTSIVLAFQNEMHRDMMDTKFRDYLVPILQSSFQTQHSFVTLLSEQWEQVKADFVTEKGKTEDEPERDQLVEEAVKLVGEELIEMVDRD